MRDIHDKVANLVGGDEVAAEAAAAALAEVGVAAVPMLLELLESADPDHRWWALRTLASTPDPQTTWFVQALADSSVEVRAAAALALACNPDPNAAAELVEALNDEDGLVAVSAAKALANVGAASVPHLLEAFANSRPMARIQIMRVLAQLRDPRAIRLMMDSLTVESAALQYWASEGLERMGLSMVYVRPE